MTHKTKNLREQANDLAGRIGPQLDTAREKAGPIIADAIDKAGPALSDARDKAAPVIADARERLVNELVPAVTAAVAAATEASAPVREESKRRGLAAVAALKGDVDAPAPKRHRIRKALIVLGLGGIAAVVAKLLSGRDASTAWQSSYTPPATPPASPPAPGPSGSHRAHEPEGGDDEAAATPDEAAATPDVAAADAEASPHQPTTPDSSAEEVPITEK